MDESLKARLIGAVVLVLVAVLLIPELLSGRKAVEAPVEGGTGPRGTRTFTIELGGGKPPADVRESPAPMAMPAPRPAAEPAPTEPDKQEAVAASTPAPPDASTASAPAPAREDAASPAAVVKSKDPVPPPRADQPPPVAGDVGWFVQVGAFGTAEAANRLVRGLKGDGYPALVVPVTRGGRTLHRVRVGPAPDKAGADQLAVRLKARGLPAAVVQND
jgi:DedD protein